MIEVAGLLAAKKEQRRQVLRARRALEPACRQVFDAAIRQRLQKLPAYERAQTVFCYVSLADEPATQAILAAALAAGKTVAVPFIADAAAGHMEAVRLKSLSDLVPGAFGIPTAAPETRELIAPASLDFIVVPGAAFDRAGHRLGMGGGYYDRFLQRATNAVRAAVAYECQLLAAVPVESFDETVDCILTEQALYSCK